MKSAEPTVAAYLDSLPAERRAAIAAVRSVIKKNLPRGFEEGMLYEIIGYYIPLSKYPDTYNGQPLTIAALASQKNALSLYLMCVYGDGKLRAWFEKAWKDTRLDMGKSCVRFKSAEDVPLDVVGQAIYEASRTKPKKKAQSRAQRPPARA
jgi:hypothetical protein